MESKYDEALTIINRILSKNKNKTDFILLNAQIYYNKKEYKKALETAKVFDKPIVTEITAIDVFYVAEDYHQNYYNQNSTQGYCAFVINPKIEKLKKVFKDKLKK